MGPRCRVVSGLSTAAIIQTTAMAAVQPMTERSELVGVEIVVMYVKLQMRDNPIATVVNEAIGRVEDRLRVSHVQVRTSREASREMTLRQPYPPVDGSFKRD